MSPTRPFILIGILIVAALAATFWLPNGSNTVVSPEPTPEPLATSNESRDTQSPSTAPNEPALSPEPIKNQEAPATDASSDGLAAGIRETQRSGTRLDRVDEMANAPALDAERWRSDAAYREDYLAEVSPGRIHDIKPFGKDVPRLKAKDYRREFYLESGGAVEIAVVAVPDTPVSFTILDLGAFANGYGAQTVVADADGIATVTYHAIKGVVNDGDILVGSPACSGQLRLTVNVSEAQSQ